MLNALSVDGANKTLIALMNIQPGRDFGVWLKAKRRSKQIIARIFAGRVGLSPAEYAEVEEGIVKWLREKQKSLIPILLDFSEDDIAEFNHKLYLATEAGPVEFSDIFTEDQLTPVRMCNRRDEPLTPELKGRILKAVFTPLA